MTDSNDVKEYEDLATSIASHLSLKFSGFVGSGAFKHTFRVETQEGHPKALKLYKSGANARTDREVEAIQRCSHPAVARFEKVGTWAVDGRNVLYSLEEYLDGGTFSTLMNKGTLDRAALESYALQLIAALEHLSGLGLVHRDIKPDNIMLRASSGLAVLVDFGLVRDLSKTSLTKTWFPQGPGTPYYASPEQLNNEKNLIDWRSDQFSLGIVLGEAGYGAHPFLPSGADPAVAVEAVALRKPITEEFRNWAEHSHPALVKMLAPWPVGRFRTPANLRDAWNKEKC